MNRRTLRRCVLLAACWSAALAAQETGSAAPAAPGPRVERCAANPIIRPEMLPAGDGDNINGPSLIRVPAWLPNPLGKYYLYFADHHGDHIRLAYADRIEGPWKVHAPGTLHLRQVPDGKSHVASPDVIVDDASKELRMYFHSPSKTAGKQTSYLARSADGLHFIVSDERLGPFYFRVFHHGAYWYAMSKRGWLCRSKDGVSGFEAGPNPFPGAGLPDGEENGPGMRHVAVDVEGDVLWVYYSNIGDMPERILRGRIALTPDWKDWKAGPPEEVLRPEKDYEGIDVPLAPSKAGSAKGRENALRDPAIFREDGRVWLLYSVAGENGIGIAELTEAL